MYSSNMSYYYGYSFWLNCHSVLSVQAPDHFLSASDTHQLIALYFSLLFNGE